MYKTAFKKTGKKILSILLAVIMLLQGSMQIFATTSQSSIVDHYNWVDTPLDDEFTDQIYSEDFEEIPYYPDAESVGDSVNYTQNQIDRETNNTNNLNEELSEPITVNSDDVSLEDLLGEWEGTYENSFGIGGMRLSVFQDGEYYRAIMTYFPVEGQHRDQLAFGSISANVWLNDSTGNIEMEDTG